MGVRFSSPSLLHSDYATEWMVWGSNPNWEVRFSSPSLLHRLRYGMDGLGIESRLGGEIVLTKPPIQWALGLFWGLKRSGRCADHTLNPFKRQAIHPRLPFVPCVNTSHVTGPPLPCTFNKICHSSSYAEFCMNLLAGRLSHSLPKLSPTLISFLNCLILPLKSNNPTLSVCFKTSAFLTLA